MTFDAQARAKLKTKYLPCDLSNVKPHDLTVDKISCRAARPYIATFHYSRTMPDSSRFAFGLYYRERIVGVCVFGMGCGKNQYTAVCKDIKNGEYIELTRLWLEDTLGRNSESYFISRCLKLLPKEIKLVLSFSDSKQNHFGYIYQATNWIYLGINGGAKMLINKDGYEAHPRLLGIYKMRHKEYRNYDNERLMALLGFSWVRGGAKHKYIYIRDKRLKKRLALKSLPYPKGENLIKRRCNMESIGVGKPNFVQLSLFGAEVGA